MGDDGELQQTSIPISDNGSSQPPRPTAADLESENVRNASPSEHPDGDTQPSQADGESPLLNAGQIILLVLALIICIPLYLIYALGVYLVCNKDASDMSTSGDDSPQKKPSFHQRVREFQGTAVQVAKVAAVINSRVVILLMIWLDINLGVRSLRKKIILGSELWKWSLLIVIIFCGYSVISMVTRLVLYYFTKAYEKSKSAVYYAEGLRRSVNFLLLWILFGLTWHFYFRSHKGLRKSVIENVSVDDLKAFKADEDNWNLLYEELKREDPHAAVTLETIEKWMVRAHKNCLTMGYTLTDAKEVVHCLDMVMSAAMIVVIFIAWLLLTGFATTKLLVLIASPFLAITFIFGDTCKTLFEGIMFVFARHPFDVGDLCIVDGCQLEVKRIGVLTTIFLAIDGKQEMWYPNSVLITKAIVNLKRDPDLNDCLKLNLDNATESSQIEALERKIKNFLKNDPGFEDSCHIEDKEIESSFKIAINFKHLMDTLEVSHSQCFEKKSKQRTKLRHNIREFLQELKIKTV